MRTKKCLLFLWVCLALAIGTGNAEEKFGVVVYTGAKQDSETSDFLKQMSPQSTAYRTSDSVEKVVDFYKKQSGYILIGDPTHEGAWFKKGKADVTIQSPWMDTKTGKMNKDTLISIVIQR